jgi:septum formation protein
MIAIQPTKNSGRLAMADAFKREIILASGSRFRRHMLEHAGLTIRVVPADVDEAAIRSTLTDDNPDIDAADVAEVLARAKAEQISALHPAAIVIGADQVLVCGGEIFAKPATVAAARTQLLALRGLAHALPTAVVLAEAGQTVWSHVDEPQLTMRTFSDAFVDEYLAAEGADVTETVGAYKLEGRGVQLFEAVEGNYFTIIGLPLIPLLTELRARGVLAE